MSSETNKKTVSINSKGEHKVYTVAALVPFGKLPSSDTQTPIEADEKKGISEKIIIKYSRPNLDAIYGSKSKNLEPDAEARDEVDTYLKLFYDEYADKSKKSEGFETFEQWKSFQTLYRVSTVLIPGIAKRTALSLAKQSLSEKLSEIETLADSGEADKNDIARVEAMLAKMKAAAKNAA